MPWDSQAEREDAELENEGGDVRASLGADFTGLQQELGFGLGADSPYSQAAMLKERREAEQRGATNGAGNQIYAGSTINKLRSARRRYDVGYKDLEDRFAQGQAAYNRGVVGTARDSQLGHLGVQEGALNRAVAAEPQPLAVPTRGRGRGAGSGVKARGTARSRNRGRGRL